MTSQHDIADLVSKLETMRTYFQTEAKPLLDAFLPMFLRASPERRRMILDRVPELEYLKRLYDYLGTFLEGV